MDIIITTTDPHEVSANEIVDALTTAGYFVARIEIRDREGRTDSAIADPDGRIPTQAEMAA